MIPERAVKDLRGIYLSEKALDVIHDESKYISLEGTTGSLKSITVDIAFMNRVRKEPKNHTQFAIVGSTVPLLERTIIDNPNSFYNRHKYQKNKSGRLVQIMTYKKSGQGGSRIEYQTKRGIKHIYFAGFDNKARFKQILGMTLYGIWCDEIQTANDEFIGELFTRLARDGGFLYTTSNAGFPDQLIYTAYLNKGRPSDKWIADVPKETLNELYSTEEDSRYRFYWFGFKDNPMMTDEQISDLERTHPVGSFEYNSKIVAIRGFLEGAIYHQYMSYEKNMVDYYLVWQNKDTPYPFVSYTIGIDVGSTDFTVITLTGFTRFYKEAIVLDYCEINHSGIDEIWKMFDEFLTPYYEKIGLKIYGVFIDSAAQILKNSLAPRLRQRFNLEIANSYKYTIRERIDWGIRFLHQGRLKFTTRTKDIYQSFTKAKYTKSMKETDIRDFIVHIDKDRIDASEYSITPFIQNMLQVI